MLGDLLHYNLSLPHLPSSEKHGLEVWAYLMPLKSEEETSDILLEEIQCGKTSVTINEICS